MVWSNIQLTLHLVAFGSLSLENPDKYAFIFHKHCMVVPEILYLKKYLIFVSRVPRKPEDLKWQVTAALPGPNVRGMGESCIG